jgi:hypothetical protein
MSYTVVWLRAVERRLTELWNTASDRQSIADAADKIDAVLRQSPSSVGESRERGIRILLQKPLGAVSRTRRRPASGCWACVAVSIELR